MKYKMVVFDFDGTLADSLPWVMTVVNQVGKRFRIQMPTEVNLELMRTLSAREIIQYFNAPFWKLPFIAHHIRSRMSQEISQIPLFEGVDAVLRNLSEHGLKLAVLTSNSQENVCRVLGAHNAALIDHFECNVSVYGKRRRINRILKIFNMDPTHVICIGDEIRDLEAAKSARTEFGAVAWGYTRIDILEAHAPHAVFTSMGEILEKIIRPVPAFD